jgi:hypothetical protein
MSGPDDFIFACPHCKLQILVPRNGVNCQIFRHGAYKATPSVGISPHAPKAECDRLVAAGLIYGCGKPFRFDGTTAAVCDYV